MTALSSPQWPLTDLVARLRALHEVWGNESADRLEALTAEVAKLRDDIGPGVTGAELRALVNRERAAPCDWDQESFCVEDGCREPASHGRLDSIVGDTPVYEMVCCQHAEVSR